MDNDSQPKITLRTAMATDVGVVRDHNEDAAHMDEAHRFFIVADGMGGHAAGEVASAMAVDTVRGALDAADSELQAFTDAPSEEGRKTAVSTLEAAVRSAHQAVYERGMAESDKQGMGTTLDVVLVAGPEAFVAHVGDSRTYLVRDGKAAQITTDHTVAEVLVIEGKLSIEEAQISPLRTILVNAIGVAPDVGVEMAHVQLRKDDILLLCSDGLHDYFPSEQELADQVTTNDPEQALQHFIDLAKERGGHDNITGVVVQVLDCVAGELGTSDGVVSEARGLELSDGIPGHFDSDDTMPVDVDLPLSRKVVIGAPAPAPGSTGPSAHRTTDPDMDAVSLEDTIDHPIVRLTDDTDDTNDADDTENLGKRDESAKASDDGSKSSDDGSDDDTAEGANPDDKS